jgi:hypothetical protein
MFFFEKDGLKTFMTLAPTFEARVSTGPAQPFRRLLLPFFLMLCAPAEAGRRLDYTARLRGIPLITVEFCMAVNATSYQARMSARTVGLADILVHGRLEGHASGAIDAGTVKPHDYVEHGRLAGAEHDLAIDYPGGTPKLEAMTPPDTYRLAVPQSMLPGAIDGLGALVLQAVVTTRTGACNGAALIFDGRQLRRLTSHSAGQERLTASSRNIFAGSALRCDTQSVMLAGFFKDQAQGPQMRPRSSSTWLAPLTPGAAMVPVRITFDADLLGDIVVDLDGSGSC